MRPIKNFQDFINEGIVKKQSPDLSRSNFLSREAEKQFNFLLKLVKNFGINDENANSIIKPSYDVIMGKVRAVMLSKGFNSLGLGTHEAEVSFLRLIGFKEVQVQFADQLRYSRNGIMYYGKLMDQEYASEVFRFLKENIVKIKV